MDKYRGLPPLMAAELALQDLRADTELARCAYLEMKEKLAAAEDAFEEMCERAGTSAAAAVELTFGVESRR